MTTMGSCPSSGAISLSHIRTAMGRGHTGSISMSQFYRQGSYVTDTEGGENNNIPTSGSISMSNFHGSTGTLYHGVINCVFGNAVYQPKGNGAHMYGKNHAVFGIPMGNQGSSNPTSVWCHTDDKYKTLMVLMYSERYQSNVMQDNYMELRIQDLRPPYGGTDSKLALNWWGSMKGSSKTWLNTDISHTSTSGGSNNSAWFSNATTSLNHSRHVIPSRHTGNVTITIYPGANNASPGY